MANAKELSKTVFVYDEDGYFENTHIAQVNPRKPGSWLFPPRSTTVKPAMAPKVFYRIKDKNDTSSDWDAVPFPEKPEDFLGLEIPHQSRTMRNEILRKWLRKFVAEQPELWREKHIDNDDGSLKAITIEAIPQPTPEELLQRKEEEVRAKRNMLLSQTDYLVSGDYPISEEDLVVVKQYRQELRDIPEQPDFPEEVVWPTLPKVTVIRE